MNTVAQRKIPEEWTPEMWQKHVCEQEKRISSLEQTVSKLEQLKQEREQYGQIAGARLC